MEYVTLANGVKMPQLGCGVYQSAKGACLTRFPRATAI